MRTIPIRSRFPRHRAAALMIVALFSLTNVLGAATIRGLLRYNNGAPAAEIAVRLVTAQGTTPFYYSGRDGMYYLDRIPAGNYTLQIWKNRVMVGHQNITVREPTTDVRVFTLPP
jgi:Carboxypeptidase regulatory-like domain